MIKTTMLAALALSLAATPLFAQSDRPSPGDRVRIQRAGESATRIFTLSEVVADTLVLQTGNEGAAAEMRMLLGSVARLQVSRGQRSSGKRALRGAARGFGAGALAGGIIGLASGDDPPSNWFAMTAAEKAVFAGVTLGAAGLLVGTVVGLLSNGEQWQTVPLNHFSVSHTSDGNVVLGYRFPL